LIEPAREDPLPDVVANAHQWLNGHEGTAMRRGFAVNMRKPQSASLLRFSLRLRQTFVDNKLLRIET